MNSASEPKPATKRSRKMAREPKTDTASAEPKRSTKADLIVAMLTSVGGAALNELIAATGWLPHTTRAALTGLKKKGYTVTSEKHEGIRRYHIEGGAI